MIYFCIPAHNEERTVGVVLWKLRQVMAELNRDYQIIVVDDASTDSTPAVLSPYIRVLPLTVIRNSERRGYADSMEVAVREAVRRAPYPKRDAIITLQADFTEDPDIVPTLVKKIEAGADIVATTIEVEAEMPRTYRWGRKLFHWLLRGREWALFGDPLSGLRAYRVVTMKRALESRGAGRLLSWNDWGANVELLSLTVPHSRRTDVVDATLKHHRHQRDSRFSFMDLLREVRGAGSGKANASAHALPTDGVIATPLPIAQEQAAARQHHPVKRGRGHERVRERVKVKERRPDPRAERGPRAEKGQRPDKGARPEKAPRPEKQRPPRPARAAKQEPRPEGEPSETQPAVATAATPAPDEVKKKRRRRPRRRKDKKATQAAPQLVLDINEAPAAEVAAPGEEEAAAPAGEAPKKKSRRGRRGGRGRRRTPRANEGNATTEMQDQSAGGDAPPPLVAEGD